MAVYSNVRTTINAQKPGFQDCFNTAFRAGAVMGFALNGLGLVVLYITLLCYRSEYPAHQWYCYSYVSFKHTYKSIIELHLMFICFVDSLIEIGTF